MKQLFLQRAGQGKLLLFFHGWSMDETVLAPAGFPADYDILCCYDYRELSVPEGLEGYQERILVAWSLGVWAAAQCRLPRFDRAIAVNGTLRPVSAEYGIDPAIFSGTAANWLDPAARRAFYRRTGGAEPAREPEEQRGELLELERQITSTPVPEDCYDLALTGLRDRIFPAARQQAFWGDKARATDWPHAFPGLTEVLEIGLH